MNDTTAFSDHEMRLIEMGGSFIAIDERNVRLADLTDVRPGQIVRCWANPSDCIRVFYTDEAPVGCVAGWISDEDAA